MATALYLLGSGRIAGIAGIVASPLRAVQWKARSLQPGTQPPALHRRSCWSPPGCGGCSRPGPAPASTWGRGLLLLAGLLVGVGVRMGNGCTSGHGVCGLSRFSLRSLVNVLAFMGAGFATVYVMRHLA